ncbi:MAG TPA: ATP-binding cassette domain-containing protein, partial [Petrotogaceae bacterium]|nr:ATP-binding cassette domain-containing protein [Petrotogaceae bacterium]
MNQAIEINLLNKFYDNFHVLKDISLSIQENRIYGLIGRNGAGKTTLMKTIAGQI